MIAGYLFLALFPQTGGGSDTADGNAEQRQRLRSQIEDLKKNLEATREKRDDEQVELEKAEKKIGQLLKRIRGLDSKLVAENTQLGRLQQKQKRLTQELSSQSSSLDSQIRAAYTIGQQQYLKILLNQKNPADMARVLTYYRYLTEARSKRINTVTSALQSLDSVQQNIAKQAHTLTQLRQTQIDRKKDLDEAYSAHKQIIVALNREVSSQSEQLKRLQMDEQQLGSLVTRLQDYLDDITPPTALRDRFGKQRGRLNLPAKGRIIANFGEKRRFGDLRWKGVFLTNRVGTQVNSVFRGRVAYADWLRGFGLLLIIEHGDGFMTLYGHNQSLYKDVGDWVETGQMIASSGNTGNPPASGLYFEVRHNGQPQNPLKWCNRH